MDVQQPKGMRDFPPGEKIFRDKAVAKLKATFERFGFAPLETPVLERYDVLSAKYAGGAEILKETFKLTDQGGRELALRYDLTVPLARYVGMNADVKLPFKRYQIEKVYRDGPIKLGRYREFYQCDCDMVGANSAISDAQCLQLALAVFSELGLDVTLSCNSVGLLRAVLRKEGVDDEKLTPAMLILDKLKKIGKDGVERELEEAGIGAHCADGLIAAARDPTNLARIASLKERYGELPELTRVDEVLALVPSERVAFDPSLSRGLSYYTGMVFEGFLEDGEVKVSLCGGGRYDRMVGEFLGKPDDYPAVGISFGLEPIMDALNLKGAVTSQTATTVFVVPVSTLKESNALAQELRASGINADIDLLGRGISKNLEYANALGIPYVVILGKRELEQGTCTLKDMREGAETRVERGRIASAIRDLLGER